MNVFFKKRKPLGRDPWVWALLELAHHIEDCHRCKTFGVFGGNCGIMAEMLPRVYANWEKYLEGPEVVTILREVLQWAKDRPKTPNGK